MARTNTIEKNGYKMVAVELADGMIQVTDNNGQSVVETQDEFATRVVNAIAAGAKIS